MKRRIQSVFLITVVLGGHPLGLARAGRMLPARVEVGPIAPDRIEAIHAKVLAIKGVPRPSRSTCAVHLNT